MRIVKGIFITLTLLLFCALLAYGIWIHNVVGIMVCVASISSVFGLLLE